MADLIVYFIMGLYYIGCALVLFNAALILWSRFK